MVVRILYSCNIHAAGTNIPASYHVVLHCTRKCMNKDMNMDMNIYLLHLLALFYLSTSFLYVHCMVLSFVLALCFYTCTCCGLRYWLFCIMQPPVRCTTLFFCCTTFFNTMYYRCRIWPWRPCRQLLLLPSIYLCLYVHIPAVAFFLPTLTLSFYAVAATAFIPICYTAGCGLHIQETCTQHSS